MSLASPAALAVEPGTSCVHELQHGVGILGHLVLELPGGVVGETEEPGLFGAKLRQARDGGASIVGAAALGACPGVFKDGLASGAIGERGQIGLLRGVLQGNDVTLNFALLGGFRGGGDFRFAQAGEGALVRGDVGRGLGGGEQLGFEGGGKRGLLFVQLLQFLLVGGREVGARVDKFFVLEFEQAQRLRIELERSSLPIDRGDALEELRVQKDGIAVGGQLGRLDVFYFLQRGIEVGGRNAVEHVRDAVEQLAGLFHRHDCVLECGRRGIIGDRLHLLALLGHAGFDGGLIIGVLDFVEWRRLKRQCAGRIERIAGAKGRVGGQGRPNAQPAIAAMASRAAQRQSAMVN